MHTHASGGQAQLRLLVDNAAYPEAVKALPWLTITLPMVACIVVLVWSNSSHGAFRAVAVVFAVVGISIGVVGLVHNGWILRRNRRRF